MKKLLWLTGGYLLVSLSCSSILGPDRDLTHDTNWRTKASRHCVIYFRPASFAERDIDNVIRHADASYEKIVETLQIGYSGVISVYLYDTPQDAGWKSCGGKANPRTETIKHVYGLSCFPSNGIYQIGSHEFAHVITWNALGEPGTMLLSEGFAEATEETWWGKAHHLWTRQFILQNKLPSLKELSDNMKWFKFAASVSYPTAGSFVKYLIETHGLDKAKTLFYKAPSRTFKDVFKSIYGIGLAEAEGNWKNYCLGL